MVIVSKFWTNFFSFGKANAITIYPFVFLKFRTFKSNTVLLNHEFIHLRQALELGVIIFYFWYLLEFVIRIIQYKSFDDAYLNISFEREAYANEENLNYLKKRKYFGFWKYLKKRK